MEDSAESFDLSELGERAEHIAAVLGAGRRIAVVDEDGRLVAYLEPLVRSHLVAADRNSSPFDRLVAAGQVRPATGNLLDHLDPEPADPGDEPLGEAFLRMRDEERY